MQMAVIDGLRDGVPNRRAGGRGAVYFCWRRHILRLSMKFYIYGVVTLDLCVVALSLQKVEIE
jgi:hypothetical protein